jgi:hypothetical protein
MRSCTQRWGPAGPRVIALLWSVLLIALFGCADTALVRTVDAGDDHAAVVNTVAMQPIHDLVTLPAGWNHAEVAVAAQLPNGAWLVANGVSGEVIYTHHEQTRTIVSFGHGPDELETVSDILIADERFYVADYDWNTVLLEFDMSGVWRSRIDLGDIGLQDAGVHGDTFYGIRNQPHFGSGLGVTPGRVLLAVDIGGEEPELIWEALSISDIDWAHSDPELLSQPRSIAHVEVTLAGIVCTDRSVYYVNYPNYHVIEFDRATGLMTDQFNVVSGGQEQSPTVIILDDGRIRIRPQVASVSTLPGGDIYVFRFPRFAEEYGELRSRVDVFSPEFRLIGSTQTRGAEPEDVLNAPLLTVVNPRTRTVQGAISADDLSSAARGPGE